MFRDSRSIFAHPSCLYIVRVYSRVCSDLLKDKKRYHHVAFQCSQCKDHFTVHVQKCSSHAESTLCLLPAVRCACYVYFTDLTVNHSAATRIASVMYVVDSPDL